MNCPACGTDTDPAQESCFGCGRSLYALTRGSLLGDRYEIVSTLGRGGMGMVYQAHDRELEETVAVKLLRSDVAPSADSARRFRNEIRLARRIRHPNVCAIHEYGQHGHLRFIVMEYVPGVDFKQVLRERGPLEPAEACRVAVQVAEGLQAIHEAGIVHRDLKTPNIMVDERGSVRLMDFGIAKQFEGDESASMSGTGTGLIVGTTEYMSPEQARAERIDARSDVYSLGVVIYELLTGDVPFRGDTPVATLMKHLTEPPRIRGNAAIPPVLVPVLEKALAKDREQRFGSAAEVAAALRQTMSALPPARGTGAAAAPARPPSPVTATPRPAAPTPRPMVTPAPSTRTRAPLPVTPSGAVRPVTRERPATPPPLPPAPRSAASTNVLLAGVILLLLAALGALALVWVTREPDGPPPPSMAARPETTGAVTGDAVLGRAGPSPDARAAGEPRPEPSLPPRDDVPMPSLVPAAPAAPAAPARTGPTSATPLPTPAVATAAAAPAAPAARHAEPPAPVPEPAHAPVPAPVAPVAAPAAPGAAAAAPGAGAAVAEDEGGEEDVIPEPTAQDKKMQKEWKKKACPEDDVKYTADTDKSVHPVPEPPPGKAMVFVLRPTMWGHGQQTKIGMDGQWIGAIRGNNYIHFAADPGERYLCSKAAGHLTALAVRVQAGRTYYVQQKIKMSFMTPNHPLVLLDEKAGREALDKTHPSISVPKK